MSREHGGVTVPRTEQSLIACVQLTPISGPESGPVAAARSPAWRCGFPAPAAALPPCSGVHSSGVHTSQSVPSPTSEVSRLAGTLPGLSAAFRRLQSRVGF